LIKKLVTSVTNDRFLVEVIYPLPNVFYKNNLKALNEIPPKVNVKIK
jgi:hypothetical protein